MVVEEELSSQYQNICKYQLRGYRDRIHYIQSLSETTNIPINIVLRYAMKFGKEEDFTKLEPTIIAIRDLLLSQAS